MKTNPTKENTLYVIVGPTAVGKTAVGVRLAQALQCPVLSADSRQFYREMKIGTAAPTFQEMDGVLHYFIGNKSVTESFNIYQYEKEVLEMMPEMFDRHQVLVMVGGSGLYVNSVCNGIDDMPESDPIIRQHFNELLKTSGLNALQEKLLELDPVYYHEVDRKNPARLQRALEVCIQTGKPYSQFRKQQKKERDFNIVKIGVEREKSELDQRIAQRVDLMMKMGQLQEVETLAHFRHLNALNTVGYKELFQYLDGTISLEKAVEAIKVNTRQYAKRQMTWFKKDSDIQWFQFEMINNLIENQGSVGQYKLFR